MNCDCSEKNCEECLFEQLIEEFEDLLIGALTRMEPPN